MLFSLFSLLINSENSIKTSREYKYMDEQSYINKINELEKENAELKEKLKNYTAPKRSKKFYENHKSEILIKNKEYKEKTNYNVNLSQEKKKEYARQAYLNQKAKKSLIINNQNAIIDGTFSDYINIT
jgi:hypothetical protein